jgi:hypothetical protein
VCGRKVHELTREQLYELRRQMGVMFQKGGLFSDLSVFENVAYPIREHTNLPESIIHDLVVMKLHAVGLRGAQRLMPAELSGGMGRRVALARAIALDPPLMIYDEPFAGLDPISLNVVCNLIRVLSDALGSTSVVVTYDVHEGGHPRRLPVHPRRGGDRRPRPHPGNGRLDRSLRAPVPTRRAGWPGALPLPGAPDTPRNWRSHPAGAVASGAH